MARRITKSDTVKVEEFVEQISKLLPEISDKDKQSIIKLISSNKWTPEESVRIICTKKAFVDAGLQTEEFVELLYTVLYERLPSNDEMEYWLRKSFTRTRVGLINGILQLDDWQKLLERYGFK